MPPLILASTSLYRRTLLERLGVPFTCEAPRCDEEALKDPRLASQALAEFLADAKAASVAAHFPNAIVIGSDQLVACAGAILGKPGSTSAAVAQLQRLAGREHTLITALTVIAPGGVRHRHTDVTRLTMRALNADALARVVARDNPIDCAGAYKLEAGGISLFARIDSADHTAITGLPLLALTRILSELGLAIP